MDDERPPLSIPQPCNDWTGIRPNYEGIKDSGTGIRPPLSQEQWNKEFVLQSGTVIGIAPPSWTTGMVAAHRRWLKGG